MAQLETGREDRLTREFIVNLAEVWRTLTGAFPPASREGPFVRFADTAWIALGWEDYSGRASLGKRIKQIALEIRLGS